MKNSDTRRVAFHEEPYFLKLTSRLIVKILVPWMTC